MRIAMRIVLFYIGRTIVRIEERKRMSQVFGSRLEIMGSLLGLS